MPEILINVINKIPQLSGDVRQITADNGDYTIRLVFDGDWTASTKTVLFVRENGFVYPAETTKNDTVTVPAVIGVPVREWLYVGVMQGDVRTSRPCGIPVYRSITDMITDDAVQPESSMWEDILARVEWLENYGGGSGSGGISFRPGNALELRDGVLNVVTTGEAEADNTLPITSAGVHTIVGNIGALLDTI